MGPAPLAVKVRALTTGPLENSHPYLLIYFCMKVPNAFLLFSTDREKKKSISNSAAIYNVFHHRTYF